MKKRKKITIGKVVFYLILAFLAFAFAYPFWQTLVLSFSDKVYAVQPGFKFWPPQIVLDSYEKVFETNTIFLGYANTVFRAVFGTLLTLVVTYLAAYAMRHKNLPGWSLINIFIIFTMFFGGGIVPSYLNIKSLGLLNTRWVLIIPGAAGAWNFIITRNFVSSISREMEEAATIDGASPIQTMVRIMIPLSKAVLAVIGLWSVVGHWNAWFDSMIYAPKNELVVLQTVIRRLITVGDEMAAAGDTLSMAESTPASVRAATVMVATAPILLGYPFIQKYLVKGTMVGAVKG